jgi:hypothetical protein
MLFEDKIQYKTSPCPVGHPLVRRGKDFSAAKSEGEVLRYTSLLLRNAIYTVAGLRGKALNLPITIIQEGITQAIV